jgi:hypothetical protein
MQTCDNCFKASDCTQYTFHIWERVRVDNWRRGDLTHLESHWRTDRTGTAFFCTRCKNLFTCRSISKIFAGLAMATIGIGFILLLENHRVENFLKEALGNGWGVLAMLLLLFAAVWSAVPGIIFTIRGLISTWRIVVERDSADFEDYAWQVTRDRIEDVYYAPETREQRTRRRRNYHGEYDLFYYTSPVLTKSTLLKTDAKLIALNHLDHARMREKLAAELQSP